MNIQDGAEPEDAEPTADMQDLIDRRREIDIEIEKLKAEAVELDTAIKIMQRYTHK
jgi:hypothetical protein